MTQPRHISLDGAHETEIEPINAGAPLATTAAAAPSPASPATGTAAPRRRPSSHSLLGFAERYALVAIFAAIVIFFLLNPASSNFANSDNINSVLRGQTAVAMVAIAAVFPLVAGNMDFSLGATAASSAVLAAGLMANHGQNLAVCAVACVVFGAVVGLFNGIMVTRFRLDSFVTTLGVSTLLSGVVQWYTHGQTIYNGISTTLTNFSYQNFLGVPVVTVIVVVVVAVAWFVLAQTPFGRSLYAVGSNPVSARLVGLPVQRNVMLTFVVSGTIAGAAGLLRLAVIGSANSDNGTSLLFPALAGVFLGAAAIKPGFFNVLGTVIGVMFVAFTVNGLTLSGVDSSVQNVFNGGALLVAVGLSTYLGMRRRARG